MRVKHVAFTVFVPLVWSSCFKVSPDVNKVLVSTCPSSQGITLTDLNVQDLYLQLVLDPVGCVQNSVLKVGGCPVQFRYNTLHNSMKVGIQNFDSRKRLEIQVRGQHFFVDNQIVTRCQIVGHELSVEVVVGQQGQCIHEISAYSPGHNVNFNPNIIYTVPYDEMNCFSCSENMDVAHNVGHYILFCLMFISTATFLLIFCATWTIFCSRPQRPPSDQSRASTTVAASPTSNS